MRFLVDAQLPPLLSAFLIELGYQAEHVYEIGLISATDKTVWDTAFAKGAVIVTKDEDFSLRLHLEPVVSIIWVRIGNCSNQVLIEKLKPLIKDVVARLSQGERLVEIS